MSGCGTAVSTGCDNCGACKRALDLHPPRVDPAFLREGTDGAAHLDLLVPDMHCAGCIATIERKLQQVPGIVAARANLTARRVGVDFEPTLASPDAVLEAVEHLGYAARPVDAAGFDAAESDGTGRELVRALAVAGFAAGNIMLLSVSVWAGAADATRDLFHWISALIALPAIIYAGRPFFRSAFRALRVRTTNMDVPISIGVLTAAGMSLYETATHGEHAWFDASVALLFFLLLGRFLDHRMRGVARSAAARLISLSARSAARMAPDGTASYVAIERIVPGDVVHVAAGERIPVDGVVLEGASDLDRSILTGEADPEPVGAGAGVFAGMLNLTGPLLVQVAARSGDTLLAEIVRLMEAAERTGSPFVRLADRAARLYAPAVHLLAALTFAGWLGAGAGWHAGLSAAVAVLIITCPCALGLAVPAVQVVASGLLLRRGIFLKDGAALERLTGIDTVIFDKTGTLTEGEPVFVEGPAADSSVWPVAAGLGLASRHPLARGVARAAAGRGVEPAPLSGITEFPGSGMEAQWSGVPVRFGRREWVGATEEREEGGQSEIWLKVGNAPALPFRFADALRSDAVATVAALKSLGLDIMLLSGDREDAVALAAARIGIRNWRARCLPADKAGFLARLQANGHNVLMVGDGMNDAPALASAAVSMSPATASDISQTAAAIVFTGRRLAPVMTALRTARAARRTILQNFGLAIAYNVLAVPVAMAGLATPLIAAIAMSTSSIIVTLNALRLPLTLRPLRPATPAPAPVLQEAAA